MEISWKMITDEGIEVHSTHQDYARIKQQIEATRSRAMELEVDIGDGTTRNYRVDIIGYTESCIALNYFILKIEILNNFSFKRLKEAVQRLL